MEQGIKFRYWEKPEPIPQKHAFAKVDQRNKVKEGKEVSSKRLKSNSQSVIYGNQKILVRIHWKQAFSTWYKSLKEYDKKVRL
jgi:predicted acetyltransferase